jgi:hypothetical protein
MRYTDEFAPIELISNESMFWGVTHKKRGRQITAILGFLNNAREHKVSEDICTGVTVIRAIINSSIISIID